MSLHPKVHCCSGFNAGNSAYLLTIWPVPDDNEVFKGTKRSVKYLQMTELLKSIKSSCLYKAWYKMRMFCL